MKEVIIFKRSLACVKEKGLYGVYYKGSLADIQPTHSYNINIVQEANNDVSAKKDIVVINFNKIFVFKW